MCYTKDILQFPSSSDLKKVMAVLVFLQVNNTDFLTGLNPIATASSELRLWQSYITKQQNKQYVSQWGVCKKKNKERKICYSGNFFHEKKRVKSWIGFCQLSFLFVQSLLALSLLNSSCITSNGKKKISNIIKSKGIMTMEEILFLCVTFVQS